MNLISHYSDMNCASAKFANVNVWFLKINLIIRVTENSKFTILIYTILETTSNGKHKNLKFWKIFDFYTYYFYYYLLFLTYLTISTIFYYCFYYFW